jgi:hypothetical protein
VSRAPGYFIGIYRSDFNFGRRAGVVRDAFAVPEGCARTSGPSRVFTAEYGVAEGGCPVEAQPLGKMWLACAANAAGDAVGGRT